MGYTNADLKVAFDKFGDRICNIGLNNGKTIFIGYNVKEGVQLKDISLEKIGNVDVIKIKHRSSKQSHYYEWADYITTEFIESIDVMEDAYKDFRVDPLIIKA